MAKIVQRRRGTTAEHVAFTGNEGEITVDLTEKTLRVHDGSTVGGTLLAKKDMSNVSNAVGIDQLNFADGNAGEVLQTDGSGNFSFTSQPVLPSLAMGGDLSGVVSNAQLKANGHEGLWPKGKPEIQTFMEGKDENGEDYFYLMCDKRSFLYVSGSQVTYKDGLMESGFAIENPNANSTCGCGESFAI